MVGLILWAIRFVIIVMILRIAMTFFLKSGKRFSAKPKEKIKRFKADNGSVVDGDFKEL
jgi:hypothetical protein